jgi:hypothetical protein
MEKKEKSFTDPREFLVILRGRTINAIEAKKRI